MTIKDFWEGDMAGVDYDMDDFRMFMNDLEKVLKEMKETAEEANDDGLMFFYHRIYGVPEEELY